MRILITAEGTLGDVHPFAAVAQAAARRGHTARMLVNDGRIEAVRTLGVDVTGMGDCEGAPAGRHTAGKNLLTGVIIPRTPARVAALRREVESFRPDVLLCHHVSFGTPWVCARSGVPFAMGAVAPASWTSLHEFTVYPGMPDLDRYHEPVVRSLVRLGSWVARRAVDPRLGRMRRELGFGTSPRTGELMGEMFGGIANLGLWSERFRTAAPDDPPNSAIVGFPWLRHGEKGAAGAFEPADDEQRPVLVTFGSSATETGADLYRAAAEACARLGRASLLLTNRSHLGDAPLPEACTVVEYAPHRTIMPPAALIVHHGGIGTTAEALRAGRPTVVAPFAHDQFDNAARLRRLGVSLSAVGRGRQRRIGEAIERVLREPMFADRAVNLAGEVSAVDGAARAVEALSARIGIQDPATSGVG